MDGALRLMDVPPDDIDTWLAAQAAAEAKRSNGHAVAATPTGPDDCRPTWLPVAPRAVAAPLQGGAR